jgi:hypothetical protein
MKVDLSELRALEQRATPRPWELCQHLKSEAADAACRCGYRGVVYGPSEHDATAVFQPGHELPRREEEWGSEPARYERPVEIANSQLMVRLRNAAPALLDAYAERDRLREALEQIASNNWKDQSRARFVARATLSHDTTQRSEKGEGDEPRD